MESSLIRFNFESRGQMTSAENIKLQLRFHIFNVPSYKMFRASPQL